MAGDRFGDFDNDDREYRERPRKKGGGGLPTWAIVLIGVCVLSVCACPIGLVVLLLPAVSKVRGAAEQANASNNLKQIGLGVHNYHDTYTRLPSAYRNDGTNQVPADPKTRLGWRFEILPFIEQGALYQAHQGNKPIWNSPENSVLSTTVVRTYADPSSPDPATRYRIFVGKGALYQPDMTPLDTPNLRSITDGTANTIFAVEAGDKVPWPQFNELPYSVNGSLPPLGRENTDVFLVMMLDGSVRTVKKNVDPTVLKALVTPNGKEPYTAIDLD